STRCHRDRDRPAQGGLHRGGRGRGQPHFRSDRFLLREDRGGAGHLLAQCPHAHAARPGGLQEGRGRRQLPAGRSPADLALHLIRTRPTPRRIPIHPTSAVRGRESRSTIMTETLDHPTTSVHATPAFEAAAAKYRPIFQRIAAGALDRELARELPFGQIGWLKDAGFGAARIPAELGGDGLDWEEFTELLIELAAADSNIPQALRSHIALVEENLYHHARSGDRSIWLRRFASGQLSGNAWTEPGVGGT